MMTKPSVKAQAGALVKKVLAERTKKLHEFGPLYAPKIGSRKPGKLHPEVHQLSQLDQALASDDRFQDEVADALDSFGVDNFSDLFDADPNAVLRLIRSGEKAQRRASQAQADATIRQVKQGSSEA